MDSLNLPGIIEKNFVLKRQKFSGFATENISFK
jgi:hypothetical protein